MKTNSFSPLAAPSTFKSCMSGCLHETPVEALAFLIASIAAHIFLPCLTLPLLGIGIALLTTKLVLKVLDRYSNLLFTNLTKEVCKLNKKYPKLQLIAFVFTFSMSLLSQIAGLLSGITLGCFGAVVLNVEGYKLLQQSTRKNKLRAAHTI